MPLRIGILSTAHLHVWGYVWSAQAHPEAELVGIWDDDLERLKGFCEQAKATAFEDIDALLAQVDAVVICSENKKHAELGERAANAGKHILCEKPLVTSEEEAERMIGAVERAGVKLMTAFPCRFSPAFQRLVERVRAGEIGAVKAICATNRGRCPFGWFVEVDKSGGGAMIDHVVHVTDLLRALLGEEPLLVQAQTGGNVYGQEWDDTAMLTIEFPSGIFATLDSSWSRPKAYKTWGDVTMNVVGEKGTIELDMFGPAVDVYSNQGLNHTLAGYTSNLDALMVDEFIRACLDDREPIVTGHDGLQASRVAMAGYRSVEEGSPVAV
jgi:predicted dehydrogenase